MMKSIGQCPECGAEIYMYYEVHPRYTCFCNVSYTPESSNTIKFVYNETGGHHGNSRILC